MKSTELARIATALEALVEIGRSLVEQKKKTPAPRATQREMQVEPYVASIPCLHGETLDVTRSFVEVQAKAFPAVDVEQTLLEIVAWSIANPSLRWTLTGARRGINTWLAKEQNKAAGIARRDQLNGGPKQWTR